MTESITKISGQSYNLSHFYLIISKTAEKYITYLKNFSSKFLNSEFKKRTPSFKAVKNIERQGQKK